MKTYTFTSAAEVVDSTTTAQLIITFTSSESGSNVAYSFSTIGAVISLWGDLETSFDLDDLLLTTTNFSFKIADSLGYFKTMITNEYVDLKASVEVKISGVTEFYGFIVEDSISYDDGTKLFSSNAASSLDILNKTSIYDEGKTGTAPSGEELYWNALNPLSYSYSYQAYLSNLIWAIYQKCDGTITTGDLTLSSNFYFHGGTVSTSNYGESGFLRIADLQLLVTDLFYNNSKGISSLADLLRQLAMDFCSYTGLLKKTKPFFKSLFYYDTSNVQTLGTVFSKVLSFKTNKIQYVEVKHAIQDIRWTAGTYSANKDTSLNKEVVAISTATEDTYDWGTSSTNVLAINQSADYLYYVAVNTGTVAATWGSVYTSNSSTFVVSHTHVGAQWSISLKRTSGSNAPATTLTKVSGTGDSSFTISDVHDITTEQFEIYKTRGSSTGTLVDLGQIEADFWYFYKGNVKKIRTDIFEVSGITYDFLKNFSYESCGYQIMSMKKKIGENLTIIEAIYLGAV